MKFTVLPKTRFGKYSVRSVVACVLLVILINVADMYLFTGKPNGGFWSDIPLAAVALAALLSAINAFICGLIATFKSKERALILYFCIFFGAMAIYFAVAQVVGALTGTY